MELAFDLLLLARRSTRLKTTTVGVRFTCGVGVAVGTAAGGVGRAGVLALDNGTCQRRRRSSSHVPATGLRFGQVPPACLGREESE